ncbi:CLUMA_CG008563, isoform A [Clunio marinus]|uniref:CLUMA_CG008563, isoform A n=1 Tax=Clunio marinus TaxID=568069 RepID=A0A1J1I467_9DIPT|nr:CLUMA_CG008563, isoform A [Clunio marinus]
MFLIYFWALLLIFLIILLIIKNIYRKFTIREIIGPIPKFPFGNTRKSALGEQNLIYDVDDIYCQFKEKSLVCGFFVFLRPYLLATNSEVIKEIIVKEFKKFRNNDFAVNLNKDPLIGRSPFRLKNETWKLKRSEIIPTMTQIKLKSIYPLIRNGTKNLVDYINREIINDECKVFDARNVSTRYTCDTITSSIFGIDAQSFEADDPFYFKMGEGLVNGVVNSVKSWLPFKRLPHDVESFFYDITMTAIKFRQENQIEREDFLSHLISLKNKINMSDVDIVGHCVTLFLDGFETTSLVIHHALYELGRHKEAQQKLREEIYSNDKELSYEKLLELPYLDQVFNETLRLHPPIPFTTRVYYYTSAESFIPERFNLENGGVKLFKERCVLIPFGDGPRQCLGMKFAYIQVKAAIAEIVRNFEVTVDKSTPANPKIGPKEYLNVTDHKLMLNFKRI